MARSTHRPGRRPRSGTRWRRCFMSEGARRAVILDAVSNRISVDPAICSGKPCIAGTRIMVKNILGLFAGGYAMDRVLATYPEISREDVIAALEFAGELADTVGAVTRA